MLWWFPDYPWAQLPTWSKSWSVVSFHCSTVVNGVSRHAKEQSSDLQHCLHIDVSTVASPGKHCLYRLVFPVSLPVQDPKKLNPAICGMLVTPKNRSLFWNSLWHASSCLQPISIWDRDPRTLTFKKLFWKKSVHGSRNLMISPYCLFSCKKQWNCSSWQ